jgi:glycosyltransferase involved in cell wall biosynthesis
MLPTMITVVIPCFNAAATLEPAVMSVLAQGDLGVEIILVDDCSTDDTRELARELASRHPNIVLVGHGANSGPAAARNTGLRRANGRYICFLDADDSYAPGFFAAALKHFRTRPDISAVLTGVEFIDCQHEVDQVQYLSASYVMPSNKMLQRSAVELIGGFSEHPTFRGPIAGEDGAFFQVLFKYFLSYFDQRKFCRYYVGSNSHFTRFVSRTRVENGKLVFLKLEEVETSGALQQALADFEQRFLDRCRALRNSTVLQKLDRESGAGSAKVLRR